MELKCVLSAAGPISGHSNERERSIWMVTSCGVEIVANPFLEERIRCDQRLFLILLSFVLDPYNHVS